MNGLLHSWTRNSVGEVNPESLYCLEVAVICKGYPQKTCIDYCLVCDAVQSCRKVPALQRNLLPPYSGQKNKLRGKFRMQVKGKWSGKCFEEEKKRGGELNDTVEGVSEAPSTFRSKSQVQPKGSFAERHKYTRLPYHNISKLWVSFILNSFSTGPLF